MCALALITSTLASSAAAVPPADAARVATIQGLADELRDRLTIDAAVRVEVVPHDPLLVSVKTEKDRGDAFLLSFDADFDADFLERLDQGDLRAVVAHELGHVWIFTHHPYLQTERLANDVAMRIVSRDSLERVYEKVWQKSGTKGDLARFLGQ
jgi:hypothetical protein